VKNRPDFSNFLAHFTTDREPFVKENNPTVEITKNLNAFQRLLNILEQRKIFASKVPWINKRAVCFTECPWSSLLAHSERYSPYGLGFHKGRVFACGGGPVFYIREDLYNKQIWDDEIHAFLTPFSPEYRPKRLRGPDNLSTVDYTHEREWRVPFDFEFKLSDVAFVIVKSYEDVAKFPKRLKDEIGREKFLIMDIYKQIEKLWPVHKL